MFLKKVDKLEQAFEKLGDQTASRGLPYIKALKALPTVVDSCFGVELKSGFEENIKNFKKSYLELEISVTPKVIKVIYHLTKLSQKLQKCSKRNPSQYENFKFLKEYQ